MIDFVIKELIMTTRKTVAIGMLIDASTSMSFLDENETVESLNKMIREQTEKNDVIFYGARFNDSYTLFKDGVDGKDIIITEEDIEPDGMTALLDGINNIIRDVESGLKNREVDSIIIIILTDGEENCSVEVTRENVFETINNKKSEEWNFIFLGANQDSIAVGESIGLDMDSTCDFDFSSEGVNNAFTSVSSALTRTIDSGDTIFFSENERSMSMCIYDSE